MKNMHMAWSISGSLSPPCTPSSTCQRRPKLLPGARLHSPAPCETESASARLPSEHLAPSIGALAPSDAPTHRMRPPPPTPAAGPVPLRQQAGVSVRPTSAWQAGAPLPQAPMAFPGGTTKTILTQPLHAAGNRETTIPKVSPSGAFYSGPYSTSYGTHRLLSPQTS